MGEPIAKEAPKDKGPSDMSDAEFNIWLKDNSKSGGNILTKGYTSQYK